MALPDEMKWVGTIVSRLIQTGLYKLSLIKTTALGFRGDTWRRGARAPSLATHCTPLWEISRETLCCSRKIVWNRASQAQKVFCIKWGTSVQVQMSFRWVFHLCYELTWLRCDTKRERVQSNFCRKAPNPCDMTVVIGSRRPSVSWIFAPKTFCLTNQIFGLGAPSF